jgi:diaminohydroxyphosphoribosylaminopyrimidine deaminase/5-amino-6-(5-phosphoribosylamino)uracil reductase
VPTWIFCGPRAPVTRARRLERAGCTIHRVPRGRLGLSLDAVLEALGAENITNVLVEGGGRVLGSFFDQKLADEVHIYQAPVLIGGQSAPAALAGHGAATLREGLRLTESAHSERIGDGWLIRARLT